MRWDAGAVSLGRCSGVRLSRWTDHDGARGGLLGDGRNEEQWVLACYSNHFKDTFNGTNYLVTEHGWYD